MYDLDLLEHTDTVNELLARYGVKFGIYKNNTFKEQLFPFDAIPRVIEKDEFGYLEKGLKQRVVALNLFLKDIYSKKQIVKDKVVPEDFIYASSGYPDPMTPLLLTITGRSGKPMHSVYIRLLRKPLIRKAPKCSEEHSDVSCQGRCGRLQGA